jgi:hypothetical protein
MTSLLLAGHLLCMNVGSAGPLACLVLDEWHRRGNQLAARAGRKLLMWSFGGLILGVLFGVLLGWARWTDDYAHLWTHRLGWKAAWGIAEFVFSLLLIGILVALPPSGEMPPSRWGWRTWLIVLSVTNLMYHFPPLMSIAAAEAVRTEPSETILRGRTFLELMWTPTILARSVHFILAAIASTGICILGFALRYEREQVDAKQISVLRQAGGWLALGPTLLQMLVGLWLFTTLMETEKSLLMGSDWLATGALFVSVLLALAMMQDLAQIVFGDDRRILAIRVMGYFVLIVVLMTASLDRLHGSQRREKAVNANGPPKERLAHS